MKILYLSCHSVLEYDEVKLLTEIGHDVYSHGAYRDPRGAYTLPRPGIEGMKFDEDFFNLTGLNPKTALPKELIDPFDCIIIMSGEHESPLTNNWKNINHKRVILRTIGQSVPATETAIRPMRKKGLQIVRYSPKEENIPNYAGGDEMIRFYKDPEEFKGWTGINAWPFNISQSLRGRAKFLHYDEVMAALVGFDGAKVYGSGNDDLGRFNGGEIPYEMLKMAMRDYRVYVYAGSWPASYTLSLIEVMMTGCPVVAISKKLAQVENAEKFDFYEVEDIIENEVSGFICDSVDQMRHQIQRMIDDRETARIIGERGRSRAIELFGKAKIQKQWEDFLEKGVNNAHTN